MGTSPPTWAAARTKTAQYHARAKRPGRAARARQGERQRQQDRQRRQGHGLREVGQQGGGGQRGQRDREVEKPRHVVGLAEGHPREERREHPEEAEQGGRRRERGQEHARRRARQPPHAEEHRERPGGREDEEPGGHEQQAQGALPRARKRPHVQLEAEKDERDQPIHDSPRVTRRPQLDEDVLQRRVPAHLALLADLVQRPLGHDPPVDEATSSQRRSTTSSTWEVKKSFTPFWPGGAAGRHHSSGTDRSRQGSSRRARGVV